MELELLTRGLAERYRVERELGAGGMATVYLAYDLKHARPVAIKVLRPELAASLGTDRFLREIQIAAGLDHPHILPLYDSGEVEGRLFYVMPFVEGESLRDRLTRERQLPLGEALRIARQVADALSAAHGRDVVHRDIKPENILLSGTHARVADFGIARAVSAAGGGRLTSVGVAIGTPAYMSPEQASGSEEIDGRSDLYSLGTVLYEMLAGETPYTGPTAQALLVKRLTEPLPRLSAWRETVTPELEALVHRLLARTPADRPATAHDFLEELTRFESAPGSRAPSRTGRRAVLGVAAALAVATFAFLLRPDNQRAAGTTTRPEIALRMDRGNELLKARTPEAFDAAMVEYEAAYAADSTAPEVLARLGYAHALFADWGWNYRGLGLNALRARALEFSERALAADSASASAWLARAYALAQLDPFRMRGAREAFVRAMQLDSTSAEGWYQFGQAMMYMGEDSVASSAYRRAFALDRDRPMSLMSLAAILRKGGRLEEARAMIDSAVLASRTVSSPYVHVMRGIMALDAKDARVAEGEAGLALELDTTYVVPARSLLVRVHMANGDPKAASAEMTRVLAAMDTAAPSPNSTLFASAALLSMGRVEAALDLIERSKPRGAQLWFYLRNPEFDGLRNNARFSRIVAEADPRR